MSQIAIDTQQILDTTPKRYDLQNCVHMSCRCLVVACEVLGAGLASLRYSECLPRTLTTHSASIVHITMSLVASKGEPETSLFRRAVMPLPEW